MGARVYIKDYYFEENNKPTLKKLLNEKEEYSNNDKHRLIVKDCYYKGENSLDKPGYYFKLIVSPPYDDGKGELFDYFEIKEEYVYSDRFTITEEGPIDNHKIKTISDFLTPDSEIDEGPTYAPGSPREEDDDPIYSPGSPREEDDDPIYSPGSPRAGEDDPETPRDPPPFYEGPDPRQKGGTGEWKPEPYLEQKGPTIPQEFIDQAWDGDEYILDILAKKEYGKKDWKPKTKKDAISLENVIKDIS